MKRKIQLLFFLFFIGLLNDTRAEVYEVLKEETLSEIASKVKAGPVYGPNGSLNKLIKLNPHIKNIDLIFPKQEIKLSASEEERKFESVNPPTTSIEVQSIPEEFAQTKPEAEPNLAKHTAHKISVTADTYSTRLSVVDNSNLGSATLISKDNFGFGAIYEYNFSTFDLFAYFNFRKMNFYEPSLVSISNASLSLFSSGIGARKFFFENKVGLALIFGLETVPFLTGISNFQPTLSTTNIFRSAVDASWIYYENKFNSLGINLTILQYLPNKTASFSSSSNWGGKVRIFSGFKFTNYLIETGLNANLFLQNNTLATQKQEEVGLDVKLSFR